MSTSKPVSARSRRASLLPLLLSLPGLIFVAIPLVSLLWMGLSGGTISAIWRPESLQAIQVSITISIAATFLCAVGGLPIAWWLAHDPPTGARVVRGLAMTPLVMPPVVAGTGLLLTFGRAGLVGSQLDALGIPISFTAAAAILAATFVAMPLIVLAGESAFRNLSRDHDEVARALGASLRVRLYHVMLPQLRRPLIAAVALCFGRALGEFGATITFAGSFPGRTRTVPLAVYQLLQRDQDSAIALSVALVLLSFLIMIFSGKVIRSS